MNPNTQMTSLQRVLTALSQKEPDRVPFFLLLTLHGARELGMTIKEYFQSGENVSKGQLKMQKKYGHDCLYSFFYAPLEIEAMGGEVIYREDGPPNSGTPLLKSSEEIKTLKIPAVKNNKVLTKVFTAQTLLKKEVGDQIPIIGVTMSPFSLPVMQMGFDKYIELLYEQPTLFWELMEKNQKFCIDWANAQLEAGATAITYFDPVSSPTIIPPELFLKTGFKVAQETISKIKGPVATHLASARTIPILDELTKTGTQIIGISSEEDLAVVKQKLKGRLTVLGNLNGIEMRHWSQEETIAKIKECLQKGAPGGGFILSDNHGEIPWQVSEKTLHTISETVHRWGRYPLQGQTPPPN